MQESKCRLAAGIAVYALDQAVEAARLAYIKVASSARPGKGAADEGRISYGVGANPSNRL